MRQVRVGRLLDRLRRGRCSWSGLKFTIGKRGGNWRPFRARSRRRLTRTRSHAYTSSGTSSATGHSSVSRPATTSLPQASCKHYATTMAARALADDNKLCSPKMHRSTIEDNDAEHTVLWWGRLSGLRWSTKIVGPSSRREW